MRCHGTNAPMHGMHSRHAKHRSPVLQTRPRSRLAAVKASAGGSSDAFDEPISKEALGVVFSQPTSELHCVEGGMLPCSAMHVLCRGKQSLAPVLPPASSAGLLHQHGNQSTRQSVTYFRLKTKLFQYKGVLGSLSQTTMDVSHLATCQGTHNHQINTAWHSTVVSCHVPAVKLIREKGSRISAQPF